MREMLYSARAFKTLREFIVGNFSGGGGSGGSGGGSSGSGGGSCGMANSGASGSASVSASETSSSSTPSPNEDTTGDTSSPPPSGGMDESSASQYEEATDALLSSVMQVPQQGPQYLLSLLFHLDPSLSPPTLSSIHSPPPSFPPNSPSHHSCIRWLPRWFSNYPISHGKLPYLLSPPPPPPLRTRWISLTTPSHCLLWARE